MWKGDGKRDEGGREREKGKDAGAHLVDVLKLVNDLVHHRIHALHFHLRVGALGFDAAAHHTERVAVVKKEDDRLYHSRLLYFAKKHALASTEVGLTLPQAIFSESSVFTTQDTHIETFLFPNDHIHN